MLAGFQNPSTRQLDKMKSPQLEAAVAVCFASILTPIPISIATSFVVNNRKLFPFQRVKKMKLHHSLLALAILSVGMFSTASALTGKGEKSATGSSNPAVAPGKVKWHSDFDTACQAAKKSGKPVLLFQMLGRLDQEFC